VVDLTELLKRSLDQRGGRDASGGRRGGSTPRANAASEPVLLPARTRKASSGGTKRRRSA
jgi:hypothetical protein